MISLQKSVQSDLDRRGLRFFGALICTLFGTVSLAVSESGPEAKTRGPSASAAPPKIQMQPKSESEDVIQPASPATSTGVGRDRRPASEASVGASDVSPGPERVSPPALAPSGVPSGAPQSPVGPEDKRPATSRPAAAGLLSVTRVVGEAGENIITSREVQINDVIEQAVFGLLPGQTQVRVLKGTEKSFPNDVQAVLREWVIYLEAKSFGSEQVAKGDVVEAIRQVQEGTGGGSAWLALEASPQEVAEIVERKLVSKRFLRLKLESAQVPITDDEALAYFKKNRLKFGNLPFNTFRDNIKTFLIKQQMDRRLQEWVEVLERRYKVRNFIAG